jgi:hypothetical protein
LYLQRRSIEVEVTQLLCAYSLSRECVYRVGAYMSQQFQFYARGIIPSVLLLTPTDIRLYSGDLYRVNLVFQLYQSTLRELIVIVVRVNILHHFLSASDRHVKFL